MHIDKSKTVKLLGLAIISAVILTYFLSETAETNHENPQAEPKPLYWVAPMDANYRRDKPGKSPMGMDLIPVYDTAASSKSAGAGVVTIEPHVINNLGVRTTPVAFKVMPTEISTVGYVQYDEDELIHIHPRVDGWIEKLYIKAAGEPVKKGQALYTLYSPELVNAQEEFLIALKRNNTSLISAVKARLRALQLSDTFISRLEKSKKVEQNITFYSPKAGVVDGLKIREGFYVKPGNTLMSIGNIEQVWVEAEVFERDVALVQEGLAVSMTLDYIPGKRWQGVVDYVYPTLSSESRTLKVRLKFTNPDLQLKPNMFAQITIQGNNTEHVVLVPKEAVIRTGKQDRVVLALGEGQFKSVAVSIGRVNQTSIEIVKGLTKEDVVVSSAQFLIDSESSKSSDFTRMTDNSVNSLMNSHVMAGHNNDESHDTSHISQVTSATVTGKILSRDIPNNSLTIHREAIEKWSRPAATMTFMVSPEIALADFNSGDEVSFTFEVQDELIITAISHLADTVNEHAVNELKNPVIEHSNHGDH